uniref:Uncharacterized protein n=1 Tax=Triticum urartu TaxID=4572 RepID=A0A8R7QRV7_TRIUA
MPQVRRSRDVVPINKKETKGHRSSGRQLSRVKQQLMLLSFSYMRVCGSKHDSLTISFAHGTSLDVIWLDGKGDATGTVQVG